MDDNQLCPNLRSSRSRSIEDCQNLIQAIKDCDEFQTLDVEAGSYTLEELCLTRPIKIQARGQVHFILKSQLQINLFEKNQQEEKIQQNVYQNNNKFVEFQGIEFKNSFKDPEIQNQPLHTEEVLQKNIDSQQKINKQKKNSLINIVKGSVKFHDCLLQSATELRASAEDAETDLIAVEQQQDTELQMHSSNISKFLGAVYMHQNASCLMQNCAINSVTEYAIKSRNPVNLQVESCKFLKSQSQVLIIDLVNQNTQSLRPQQIIKIIQNEFASSKSHHIQIKGYSFGVTRCFPQISIQLNNFNKCRNSAVYLQNLQTNSIQILKNQFNQNQVGLQMVDIFDNFASFQAVVSGNQFQYTEQDAIILQNSSCLIEHSIITASIGSGIVFNDLIKQEQQEEQKSENYSQKDPKQSNSQQSVLTAQRNTIIHCNVFGNNRAGIAFYGEYRGNLTIKNVSLQQNFIGIEIAQSAVLTQNIAKQYQQVQQLINSQISIDGFISYNQKAGICVESVTSFFILQPTLTIKGNGNYAIWARESSAAMHIAFKDKEQSQNMIEGLLGGQWGILKLKEVNSHTLPKREIGQNYPLGKQSQSCCAGIRKLICNKIGK